ncbi:MAG: hypothetical protein NTU44_12650 [Bacteroidetes bacterium]|nr:hypothetical protein [Bacteroidota bacterium]
MKNKVEWIGFTGACMIVLSSFLPWREASVISATAGLNTDIGLLILALGLLTGLSLFFSEKAPIFLSFIIIAIGVLHYIHLMNTGVGAGTYGVGFGITFPGCLLVILEGYLLHNERVKTRSRI